MNPREERAALLKDCQQIVDKGRTEKRAFTDDERADLDMKYARIEELNKILEDADKDADLIGRLKGFSDSEIKPPQGQPGTADEPAGGPERKLTLAERFVKSAEYQAFLKAHPSGLGSGTPVRVEAKGIGGIDDLDIGRKATITTQTGQFVSEERLPGYRSELLDEPITFLNLVTSGTTNASFIEYARIVSETDNAAIVPEGKVKPLSDVATDKADAKAYTYADGFDVTNQTLSDDGALAAFMESRIRWHLRNLIEDKLFNGAGGTEPEGILHTTGVQSQAFDTDVITTLAAALQKVEDVQAIAQAIVMNVADVWAIRLMKDTTGQFLLGNPLQQGMNPTPFGVPLVRSTRIPRGKALIGNFSSVQFLQREPLNVLAFNQHKDYAQRNMTYVRAELRALQFIYAPREIVDVTLTAGGEPDEG